MRWACALALTAWVLLRGSALRAEGSAELDLHELVWDGRTGFLAHDQAVNADTVVRVDIANGGAEKLCWRGTGSLTLRRPDESSIASVSSGNCANASAGVVGPYFADILADQLLGTEWDIRVCARSVSNAECLSVASNEQTGRVWSTAWIFEQNVQYTQRYAINGSVYAVVPGGGVGRDAVIELQMRGLSGAYYRLRANGVGPSGVPGARRVGRSAPRSASYTVNAEYPLYLSPPAGAHYNWSVPVVSAVRLAPACGSGVVLGRSSAQVSFASNLTGQYVVVCDVNKDGIFEVASSADFSSFGATQPGASSVRWDGRNNAGASGAEGVYGCIVRLNVGEFHYIAEDIESAYPGIRMYRVEANKIARTPLRMFWDDSSVGPDVTMPNGQLSPVAPLALGLDPMASSSPAVPFYFTAGDRAAPSGNARAWGNFGNSGKGNETYLDQFAAADTTTSAVLSVRVLSNGGDFDADGLTNARECDLGSGPEDDDSDDDGLRDDAEAPASGLPPNTDGDALSDLLDTDSDNDGVRDGADRAPRDARLCGDLDADGCDDCVSGRSDPRRDGRDADGDGRCDARLDHDGDGIDDARDMDDDGDGILDAQENVAGLDPDADGDDDGVSNWFDANDRGDGLASDCTPAAIGAVCAAPAALFDQDRDGAPNHLSLDSDRDLLSDALESGHAAADAEPDGRVDGLVGVNGVADVVEDAIDSGRVALPIDTDADALPDFLDADSDADGVDDVSDEQPQDRQRCRDRDQDGCDDCGSGSDDRSRDGEDPDGDGRCNPPGQRDGGSAGDAGDAALGSDGPDAGQEGPVSGDAGLEDGADSVSVPGEARGELSGGALCSARPALARAAPGSLVWLLALGTLALLGRRARRKPRAMRRSSLALIRLLALGVVGAAQQAQAQVALDQFKPAPLATDGFVVSRPELLPRLGFSTSIWLDYANDPLVYEHQAGSSKLEEQVVAHHLVGHLGAALGVLTRLTLFAGLPVHIVMQGDETLSPGTTKPDGAGLGDLSVGGRVLLTSLDPKARFASALEFIARTPTAELFHKQRQHYSGDAIGSYEPALILEARDGRFDIRARFGARLRRQVDIDDLSLGHELVAGIGMRLRVATSLFLQAESFGSTFLSDPLARTTTPVEALFGFKYIGAALQVGLAAGPGLCPGYGSPNVRVAAMLGYAPREPEVVDSDGDGILDPTDSCPRAPEDADGFEDADGCPDPDNDKDGVHDTLDACRDEPEDTDDFEDADGCPDPDNDKDGLRDSADDCPLEPEDTDDFEDTDGCPDPDNDKDGLIDVDDSCPNEPEDMDGFEDADGCAEPAGNLVKVTCAKIEIAETIYFESGKDLIQERSFALLDQLTSVLQQATHILKLRIAGHTDERGNDAKNLDLSRRRAASVLRYLAAHGVEHERLVSEGYGESEPIASNESAEGRAQNRRVEFQILEQRSACTAPP